MKDAHAFVRTPIDELYQWFGAEAEPTSPTWGRLCAWIAETPAIADRLDALPGQARQPNRFLAAIRYLDGPTEPGPDFLAWVERNWPTIEEIVLTRNTQTNEPGRCTVLAPLLASLPQPIALLELGTSGGLCLLADRYRYAYTGAVELTAAPAAAPADAPTFPCVTDDPLPADPAGLVIAARHGLDRNPLEVADPDVRRWLRALVWPGEQDREGRLAAALDAAASDPAPTTRADLTEDPAGLLRRHLDALRAQAPDATPVVLHSAALAYLERDDRDAVVDAIRAGGAHWLSFEGPTVITELRPAVDALPPGPYTPHFIVALDGVVRARAQSHGRWVHWLDADAR
ncbi:DUF2332 domain-containing protein [Propioniciclava coleopterorum]|uniref:DUF2332 domain-containing protein n=1 Tax=Propioniciclava coleopterorum TaxID=2714937 RepID=A0A6G7Y808_9ACTN|nr:DUF2332 domain-containing protein [Propioniciclava coleopterorum]QIK72952.1 DUF2332 domain-containing protein [Propioniciclava coleopterorum]